MTEQNLMMHWAGIISLIVFVVAYSLVIAEETIHLRKSKPVMVAGGIIWAFAAIAYIGSGQTALIEELVRHSLLEFVELFLFLLAAMTLPWTSAAPSTSCGRGCCGRGFL